MMRMRIHPAVVLFTLVIGLSSATFARAQISPPSDRAQSPTKRYEENEPIPEDIRSETFKIVWETVRDKYYDPTLGGKDWEKIGAEYRLLAATAVKSGEFHAVLGKMLAGLERSHLAIIAPHAVAVTSGLPPAPRFIPAGIALCAAEGRIAVASVASDSPAWSAGLRPGDVIVKAGREPFPTTEDVQKKTMRALIAARRAISGRYGRYRRGGKGKIVVPSPDGSLSGEGQPGEIGV